MLLFSAESLADFRALGSVQQQVRAIVGIEGKRKTIVGDVCKRRRRRAICAQESQELAETVPR
jgi:hypothetical protein